LTKAIPIEHKAGLLWRWVPIDQWVCSYRPRQCYLHWRRYHHLELRHYDQPCDSLPVCQTRVPPPRAWAGRRWRLSV